MARMTYYQAMARASEFLADWQIRNRVVLQIVLAVITVFLAYQATFLRMDPGFDKSIPNNHPYVKFYDKYSQVFGGANVIIVALRQKEGEIFNEEFLAKLRDATKDVEFIAGVDKSSVTSLFTPQVTFVAVNEEGFVGFRVVKPDFTPTEENIQEVRRNLMQSEYVGRLVTPDFKGALIRAELVETNPTTGAAVDYAAVADALNAIRAKYESGNVEVDIIGFAKFIDGVIDAALGVIKFFVYTVVLTGVLLYFYSNSLQITGLVLLVALTAVVWQLGLVHLLGFGVDPLSILVPFLIMSIAVSHAIQMTNTWKLEIINGADSKTAAREAFNKLFIPGTTALLTISVGFGVIMLIDIKILFELGITASIGTAVMILTNKFMLPGLLSWASMSPKTVARIKERITREERPLFRFLASFADRKRGTAVLVLSVGLLVFGYFKGHDLIIGDSEAGAPEFWPEARYNRDIDAIVSNFDVGLDEVTVIAEMARDACVNYKIMDTVDQFAWRMKNLDGVQTVRSLSDILKIRTVGNNEGHPKFYSIPRDQYGLSSAMRNMELNQKLFNDTCEAVPVRIMLHDHKADTLRRVTDAVKAFDAEFGRDEVRFRLASGTAGVMAAVNEAVEESEIRMQVALFGATFVLTYFTFVSFPGALCVLIPLGLVSLLGNAVMVMMNIGLKVSTLPVVALGVGVGVDYGIYLFARTQAFLRQGYDLKEAYYRGLRSAGTAVMFTATTMSIGVLTWAFSELKFQADMGLLLGYMFFVNMIACIFVLPALAAWIVNVQKERTREVGIGSH